MKTEQGCTSLPLFLSVSQQDEVMTEWQVYLGFPCLASRLSIAGFNVSGYHVDINGLEAVLAPAMPPSGAWWHLGEGGEGKGTDFYFSGQISPLPFIGFLCSVLLNPPVLAFHWHSSRLTWNIPWFFFAIVCELQMHGDHIFVLHWFRALSGAWLTWLPALALPFSGRANLGKLSSFLPALGVIVRIRDKHVWGLWHQDWHRWMLPEVGPPTPSLVLAPKCLLTH